MNLEWLRNQNPWALLACVLLPVAALLGDIALHPAGMAAIPDGDQVFRVTLLYVAVISASLWLPRWQQIYFVAVGATVALSVFPLYLLASGSFDIAQTVLPRRLLGVVLLWTLPIVGIRLRRAADTIQALNNDLDAKVTASVKELQQTTTRLDEAQKLSGLGNWEVRADTGEMWWSQQTYSLLGLDPNVSTACIDTFIECVHADDRARVRKAIDGIQESGRSYSINYRVRLPNEAVRYFRDQAAAEFSDDGSIKRVLGTIQDVSDQIELEHEVIAISERERTSIGHDLHDTLAQDLTALTLLIKSVESRLGEKAQASDEEFKQLYAITSTAIATTRTLAIGLSPVQIGDMGLVAGLERIAEHARSLNQIDCSVNVAGNIPVGEGIHARQV